jgi:hypothetical protein
MNITCKYRPQFIIGSLEFIHHWRPFINFVKSNSMKNKLQKIASKFYKVAKFSAWLRFVQRSTRND